MKSKNVLLGMAGVAMFSSGTMAQKPANIILINLDDSGNGDFSCRGAIGYQTPQAIIGFRRVPDDGQAVYLFFGGQKIAV